MSAALEIDRLQIKATLALSRVDSLTDYIQDLRQSAYPTRGAAHLLSLILRLGYYYQAVTEDLLDELSRARELDAKMMGHVLSSVDLRLGAVLQQLALLGRTSRFVASSRQEDTTSELPAVLAHLVEAIRPEVGVLVRPQSDSTYQFEEIVSRILPSFEGESFGAPRRAQHFSVESLLEGLPRKIGIVSFPRVEADNVLLHAFGISHELGHLVDEVLGLSGVSLFSREEKGTSESPFLLVSDDDLESLTRDYCNATSPSSKPDDIYRELEELVLTRGRRWLAEVAADLIAVAFAGPAAVAAFYWLLHGEPSTDLPAGLVAESPDYENYPWPRLRLQIMLAELDRRGFTGATFAGAPSLASWLAAARTFCLDGPKQEHDVVKTLRWPTSAQEIELRKTLEVLRIVSSCLRGALPQTFPAADDRHGDDLASAIRVRLEPLPGQQTSTWSYSPERFEEEVPLLVRDLDRGVPPCQLLLNDLQGPSPARFASILAAGWEHWLAQKSTLDAQELGQVARGLNKTLLVALEASEIHTRFQVERERVPFLS